MPRDPQKPQFFRTLRVKNVQQVGVLAGVLGVVARHGASVGDIRTVHQSRTSMVRDVVLSAHLGGKIRVVPQMPIDTFADLGRVYTPGVGEVCRRIYEDPSLADHYTIIANIIALISNGTPFLGPGIFRSRV